ncbi:V-type proton ATPase subunit G-like [Anoplophora glabripennis]|uniref:V-type proton ATPase subunit G-like n=1 Tax=Anoplophora glabripennis TaxID=217634 RepID=UPI0008755724|nr:V-type proton ATPase subunit G-like [Anoplophora glabripennis]
MAQIQTQGIQQLLAAEKRAADKVNASRRRKAKKLRQAKEEAEEEIEKFRKERDQQFHDYVDEHVGTRGSIEKQIEIDTNQKIDELNRAAHTRTDEVVKGVLDIVQEIKPIIHKNFRNAA